MYYLKGDRALGNSTLRNSSKLVLKQTNTNTVLLHVKSEIGTPYQIVSLKSSHVPSLGAIFKIGDAFFKLNIDTIIIVFLA